MLIVLQPVRSGIKDNRRIDIPDTTFFLNPQLLIKLILTRCMPDLDKVQATSDLLQQ